MESNLHGSIIPLALALPNWIEALLMWFFHRFAQK